MRILFLITVIFCPLSSLAQTGYVDLMEAFKNTKQGRRVETRLKKTADKVKKQLKAMELKIQQEEEAFKKDAPLLSEQARAQKFQKLQQKVLDFQKSAKSKEMEYQKLQNQLTNPILEKLKKVIGEVGKKESYLVIENIGNDVLWVSPKLDLTKKVYGAFNKKYK